MRDPDMDSGERRIIQAKTRFGDALREDLNRTSPALKSVMAGGIIVIVVLLAAGFLSYIYVSGSFAEQAALERAAIRADLSRDLGDVKRELAAEIEEVEREGADRDKEFRVELQTWRSLAKSDMDYVIATLKAAGVDVPPLNADTRPAFDAAVRAAAEIHDTKGE